MKLLFAASLLTFSATVAVAQTPAAPAPAPATPPATATAPPAADASVNLGFRAGLPVKDRQGAPIGSIARVIKTPDGATTFSVTVDGHNVNLPGSALTLSPAGDAAVSSLSKAQITASTSPPV